MTAFRHATVLAISLQTEISALANSRHGRKGPKGVLRSSELSKVGAHRELLALLKGRARCFVYVDESLYSRLVFACFDDVAVNKQVEFVLRLQGGITRKGHEVIPEPSYVYQTITLVVSK